MRIVLTKFILLVPLNVIAIENITEDHREDTTCLHRTIQRPSFIIIRALENFVFACIQYQVQRRRFTWDKD